MKHKIWSACSYQIDSVFKLGFNPQKMPNHSKFESSKADAEINSEMKSLDGYSNEEWGEKERLETNKKRRMKQRGVLQFIIWKRSQTWIPAWGTRLTHDEWVSEWQWYGQWLSWFWRQMMEKRMEWLIGGVEVGGWKTEQRDNGNTAGARQEIIKEEMRALEEGMENNKEDAV